MPSWPAYTWSGGARQYRGASGRFVPRTEVRAALDAVVDGARDEIQALSLDLQAGIINLPAWQLGMERLIKRAHTAAGAAAAGGWAQATPADWSRVGNIVRSEYAYLRGFAFDLAAGLPLDGRFLARARMYGLAATGTYEAVLRRNDLASGLDEERRLLHSEESCASCTAYAAAGWTPAGTLPDIGRDSECLTACRCTFQRRRAGGPALKTKTPAELGLDPEKCRRRARLAALRDGIEATPLRLASPAVAEAPPGIKVYSRGSLPATTEAALARINAGLPEGAEPLAASDLYLHYLEAGNDSYIPSHNLFLDASTLKNVAAAGESGFAFMNSHRTGGLSAPAELPYGRTFAGRYEQRTAEDGSITRRALLGVYMLKGQRPNGSSGPSTDDLDASIRAGTLSDVSLGFSAGHGETTCDLCGYPVNSDACGHVPGTHQGMTDLDIEAQVGRGVASGVATSTLSDGMPGEVSAVFKGAVSGAGFRKAIRMGQAGRLSGACLAEARLAFGPLLEPGDLPDPAQPLPRALPPGSPPTPRGNRPVKFSLSQLLGGLASRGIDPQAAEIDVDDAGQVTILPGQSPPAQASAPQTDLAAEVASLKAMLASAEAERLASAEQARLAAEQASLSGFLKDAQAFAAEQVRLGKISPAERAACIRDHAQAAADDRAFAAPAHVVVLEGTVVKFAEPSAGARPDRLARYEAGIKARSTLGLFQDRLRGEMPGVTVLGETAATPEADLSARAINDRIHRNGHAAKA